MTRMCTKVSISSSSLESYKRAIRIDPIILRGLQLLISRENPDIIYIY